MESIELTYATHLAFYREDERRQQGAEIAFGQAQTTSGLCYLNYIPASGELYLGAPGGGELELLARLTCAEAESLRARWRDVKDVSWLRAQLRTPLGPRSRLSALGGI